MDENSGNIKRDWQQQYFLGKLLLTKYGAIHDMHLFQLKQWPIACCNISIEGEVEFDVDKKTIVYNIKTIFDSYLAKDEKGKTIIKKRHKNSLFRYIAQIPASNKSIGKYMLKNSKPYEEELKIAKLNLVTWTQELLWGSQTTVKVLIDGRQI